MSLWESVKELSIKKRKLQDEYIRVKNEVREKYPYHPPQSEVVKYTKIKYKLKQINNEIDRVARSLSC